MSPEDHKYHCILQELLSFGMNPLDAKNYVDNLREQEKQSTGGFDFSKFISKPKKAKEPKDSEKKVAKKPKKTETAPKVVEFK
jgi:hypothetical protein